MSRRTDVERGAVLALNAAAQRRDQPDLFGSSLPASFWQSICVAAYLQLEECQALRAALEDRSIPSFHSRTAALA